MICNHCSADKPEQEFKLHVYGRACKDCVREQKRDSARRMRSDPDSAARLEARRARARANGSAAAAQRRYRMTHKDRINESVRSQRAIRRANDPKWLQKERLRGRIAEFIRRGGRARDLTADQVDQFIRNQGGDCANPYCAAPLALGYHIDHKIPLSRGGTNECSNLQLLCPLCNLQKHAKTMDEWQKQLSALVAA